MWTLTGRVDGEITSVTLRPRVVHPNKIVHRKSKQTRFRRLSGHEHPVGASRRNATTYAFSGRALLATPQTIPDREYDPEEALWALEALDESEDLLIVHRERAALVPRPGLVNQAPLGGIRARWDISSLSITYGSILTLPQFVYRREGADDPFGGQPETRPLVADWQFTLTRMI